MVKKILSEKIIDLSPQQFKEKYLDGKKVDTQKRYIRFFNLLRRQKGITETGAKLKAYPSFLKEFGVKKRKVRKIPKGKEREIEVDHYVHLCYFRCKVSDVPWSHFVDLVTQVNYVSLEEVEAYHDFTYPSHELQYTPEIVKSEAVYTR